MPLSSIMLLLLLMLDLMYELTGIYLDRLVTNKIYVTV